MNGLGRSAATAALGTLSTCAPVAHAQPALLEVALTDPGTNASVSVVEPGESVRVTATLSWQPGVQLAWIAGDMICQPIGAGGEGIVSNLFSQFVPNFQVTLGTVVGDDIVGLNARSTPSFFTGGGWITPPFANWNGLIVYRYDWAAPAEAGQYTFEFVPVAPAPGEPPVAVYPSIASPIPSPMPTTPVGATLTVVPTPAALAPLALAAIVAPTRRRSHP